MAPDATANANVNDGNHDGRTEVLDATETMAVVAAANAPDAVSSQQQTFNINIPPREAAQDENIVAYLTAFVNRIYYDSEASFWIPGFERTNTAEIREVLQSGALALAWRGDSSFEHHGELATDLLGCVNVKIFAEESTGEFGMLACEPQSRGIGVGRELLRFAEDEVRRRGMETMRLELLQGDGWRHEFKDRLESWYGRNGYLWVGVEQVEKNWAFLAPLLAKPTVIKVFVKQLQ